MNKPFDLIIRDYMKKIELHLHLDGSVRIETASEILGIDYDTCKINMEAKGLSSLDEYLTRFSYPIKVMQTYENIKRVSHELALDLISDEVIYAEVRFAPIFHQNEGLSLVEICKAALDGFSLESDKIKINLILCMMRNESYENNKKIIDLYLKHIDPRIVALDLAGSETLFPNKMFTNLFDEIKEKNIPFTIHSGEVDNLENIKIALDYGFKRIGHGINIYRNKDLIKLAKKKKVLLEVCFTSNVDTLSVESHLRHPLGFLYKQGLNLSINTDNRTVSRTTLNLEYERINAYFDITDKELKRMNIKAMKYSFADNNTKKEIIKLLK